MSWSQTYTRKHFDLLNPSAADVCAADIAHALSNQCRFGGHVAQHYSVAQHSVAVYEYLFAQRRSPLVCLQGLLHDATEAYVVDVPTPLKTLLPEYHVIEELVWQAVAEHFSVPRHMSPRIHEADKDVLAHEAHARLPGGPLWEAQVQNPHVIWQATVERICTPKAAEELFLASLANALMCAATTLASRPAKFNTEVAS